MKCGIAFLLVLGLSTGCTKEGGHPSFRRDIEPITRSACIRCHDQQHVELNLLDHPYRELIGQGLVVPGKPDESLLYLRVQAGHPELTPLGTNQVEQIRSWIDTGALK